MRSGALCAPPYGLTAGPVLAAPEQLPRPLLSRVATSGAIGGPSPVWGIASMGFCVADARNSYGRLLVAHDGLTTRTTYVPGATPERRTIWSMGPLSIERPTSVPSAV